jgi:hypothetical protein
MKDNMHKLPERRDSYATPSILNAWRARTAQDPDWAVDQIERLIARAIRAERELERVLLELYELRELAGKDAHDEREGA